jgi:uncharacterized ferritin-like protein (DUF455 family)
VETLDVDSFCLGILRGGTLARKLAPAPAGLSDAAPGPALRIAHPARAADIAFGAGAPPLPRPSRLGDKTARAACLARFAHHELMAVELFAWALLRFPALPGPLRRGLLASLADEQRHCGLYLERLGAQGSTLAEHPVSDYFWRHEPALAASHEGPRAFLCAMGLTFEQANLDFSLAYAEGFRVAGDEQSARVCELVHRDEIRHVRLAAEWLPQLGGPRDPVPAYEAAVPFPLEAARAKGRRFLVAARSEAGLTAEFIDYVRSARSNAERNPRSRG